MEHRAPFLRNLLLDENYRLRSRDLHINSTHTIAAKTDIGAEKADIREEKPAIDAEKADIQNIRAKTNNLFTAKTADNICRLL